jgi:CheY-like chemotaxis protein
MSTCIAVIDDDAACRELLHELLSEEGYAVHPFPDSATAARCLRALAPAAIILDVRLERPTAGREVLADLRRTPCSTRRRSAEAGVHDPGQTLRHGRVACSAASNWHVERPQHLLPLQAPGDGRSFARTTTSPGRASPGDTVMRER